MKPYLSTLGVLLPLLLSFPSEANEACQNMFSPDHSNKITIEQHGLRKGEMKGTREVVREVVSLGSSNPSSRVGVRGLLSREYLNEAGKVVYLSFSGPTELVEIFGVGTGLRGIRGQGVEQHREGFGTPVGSPVHFTIGQGPKVAFNRSLDEYTPSELLLEHGVGPGQLLTLDYDSGVTVHGHLRKIQTKADGRIAVLQFEPKNPDSLVEYPGTLVRVGENVVFGRGWGVYDLLVNALPAK